MSTSDFRKSVALALALAMIAGAGEVGRVLYQRYVEHTFAHASRDIYWMAPAAFAVLLLATAVVLALLGIAIPPLRRPRVTTAVLVGITTLSLVFHVPRVHPAALVLLALGLTTQWLRWLGASLESRTRQTLMVGGGLGVLLALMAGGERFTRSREERALAAAAPAPADSAPNVLFLLLDTVRASHLSLYGYERQTTPRIEAFARDGMVFDRAYSPSSWTLPSHTAFFTGHRSGALGVDWRVAYDGRAPLLASAFRDAGYATGAFTSNAFYVSHESGLSRGFVHFDDYKATWLQAAYSIDFFQIPLVLELLKARRPWEVRRAFRKASPRVPHEPPFDRRDARDVTSAFLEWERQRGDRPYFAFLNLFDAHAPIEPPPAWRTKFSKDPRYPDLYDAGIAYMDHEIGVVLDSLRARGSLERTIVVITSDHGEHFGEHGLKGHGNSLYLPLVHVPLVVVHGRRLPADRRIDAPISLTDLPRTLLSMAGIRDARFPGRSLLEATANSAGGPGVVLTEVNAGDNEKPSSIPTSRGALSAVLVGRWHYIKRTDGAEQLFDTQADPGEEHDRAADPASAAALAEAREALRVAQGGGSAVAEREGH